jgi:hypothetical protein
MTKLPYFIQKTAIFIFVIILSFLEVEVAYGDACSLKTLSYTNIECWNNLFGEFVYFKGIVSFEVTDLSGENDTAVIFIALGHPVEIPKGTLILPEGVPYDGSKKTKDAENENNEEKVVNQVFYGLIMQAASSGKSELKIYGDAELYEYDGNCDADYDRSDSLKGSGIKRFCTTLPTDSLPTFETRRIFSNKPPLLVYHFEPAGDASGVYDAAYIYRNRKFISLLSEHNGKYDLSTLVSYEKDKIIMNSPLNTPFEPAPQEAGYWYFNSFTLKTGYVLENDKLIVAEEKIEPTSIDISEECGNWCIENYKEKINIVLKKQQLFKQGKNKWLGDPLTFVRHSCPKCKSMRTVFQKDGVAIVWADVVINGSSKRVSYYLYKPFFNYKKIGKKSIWQEVD